MSGAMRHYNADDARREAIVQAMKGHVRAARLDAEYDADIEYMGKALVALVDEQLQGAVEARDVLLTIMREAAGMDAATCRKWIRRAVAASDAERAGGRR